MNDLGADAMQLAASYYAKPVAVIVAILVFGWAMDCHGKRSVVIDQTYKARVDTVRITDSVRAVATKVAVADAKITKAAVAVKAHVDSALPVIVMRDTIERTGTLFEPRIIVEKIAADSTVIVAQARELVDVWAVVAADSAGIRARDRLLATPKPRSHWGLGVTGGYVCGAKGCGPGVGVGIVWRF